MSRSQPRQEPPSDDPVLRTAARSGEMDSGVHQRIAAVVVYFRTPTSLMACLDALGAQSTAVDDTVVIDNSSALDGLDGPPVCPVSWRWVRAASNLGFGSACNLGASATNSDYLLLLNADVTLREEACERLFMTAEADPRIAVVGPRIYSSDGQVELSARAFPRATTGFLGRSSLATRLLAALTRTPSPLAFALGPSGRVDWVSGACMLVRREAFNEVGGFDESYWMYWEDADMCRRLRDRGWTTALCVEAEADHATGSSGRSVRTITAFHASAARYYERHVARTRLGAAAARRVLDTRMKLILRRHDRRDA